MTNQETIFAKIKAKSEIISIIGLGYVCLPLAVNFAEPGIKVIGFEKSKKTDLINPKEIKNLVSISEIRGLKKSSTKKS